MKKSKNLTILALIVTFFTICIIIFNVFAISSLDNLSSTYTSERIKARVDEYTAKVQKKIDSQFELLNSISGYYTKEEYFDDSEFQRIFVETNKKNEFYGMYFIGLTQTVYYNLLGSDSCNEATMNELDPRLQDIIGKSLGGDSAISDLFNIDNKRVIGISIPAMTLNGEIKGVLAATFTTDVYSELLESALNVDDINEHIDFIYRDGTVISVATLGDELNAAKNIFDGEWFTEEDKEQCLLLIDKGERFSSNHIIYGVSYKCYFNPIDGTDWYLLYADTNHLSYGYIRLVSIIKYAITAVLMVVTILNFYLFFKFYRNQRRLERLAYCDTLTNAYNFTYFKEFINTNRTTTKAIINLTIQKFRYINMEFGSIIGDSLLKILDETIRDNLLDGEIHCRENADNFWISLNRNDDSQIKEFYETIQSQTRARFNEIFTGYTVELNCGIALNNQDDTTILECARIALRETKEKNRSIVIYGDDVNESVAIKRYVESRKNLALINHEFKPYFQPKINYETKKIESAEVLVRWHTQEGNILYPNQFIPTFESTGFSVKLDIYMFEEACKFLRDFKNKYGYEIGLSINQSKLLFYKPDYVDTICEIADRYKINHSLITLELLESLAFDNILKMNEVIQGIRSKGFKVSLDDFGSGYSSLNSLEYLELDEIKIDREFIANFSKQHNLIILDAISRIAKSLNAKVVAEGVETKEQEKLLNSLKIEYGQGYLYSKPIDKDNFINLLKKFNK